MPNSPRHKSSSGSRTIVRPANYGRRSSRSIRSTNNARWLYLFGKMKYEEGVDRVNARIAEAARTGKPVEPLDATARQLFEQAIDEWKRLVSKYPQAEDPTPAVAMELIVRDSRRVPGPPDRRDRSVQEIRER